MIEFVTINNYHGGVSPGYFAVQAENYYAWWDHQEPELLRVRHPDGSGLDWLEVPLVGSVSFDGKPVQSKPEVTWADETEGVHPGSFTERTVEFSHSTGEKLLVTFLDKEIVFRLKVFLAKPRRITSCTIAGTENSGIKTGAVSIFDSRPASHGIYTHTLSQKIDTKNNWLSPGPFCYPLEMTDGSWASVSVEPEVDELLFSNFQYKPVSSGALFFLDYKSAPEFEKEFLSPPLVCRFQHKDQFDAIRVYANAHARRAGVEPGRAKPESWWQGLMLCGWPNQGFVAQNREETPQEMCLQSVYEDHIKRAEDAGINPDIITIDDNWAVSRADWQVDTQKWPDLPGFIEKQHREGRHVLLWVCAATDGIPEQELYRIGDPPYREWANRLIDPHNQDWITRLEENVYKALGRDPDCLKADGFKLDFTGNLPTAGVHHAAKELHGYTHLWWFFKRVHDAAKKVNPECLLDFQVANPLFAGFHDMTRLNDYFLPMSQALRVMGTRAAIADAAAFSPLVDTDCPISPEWYRGCTDFGNPSLYLSNEHFSDPQLVAAINDAQKSVKDK